MFIGENLKQKSTNKRAKVISIFTIHKYPQLKKYLKRDLQIKWNQTLHFCVFFLNLSMYHEYFHMCLVFQNKIFSTKMPPDIPLKTSNFYNLCNMLRTHCGEIKHR